MNRWQCSHCHRPIRHRCWIAIVGDSVQCDRLLCRLRSGHWLWMHFGRELRWRTILKLPFLVLRVPVLKKVS